MSKVSQNYKVFLEEVVTSSQDFRDHDQDEDHDFVDQLHCPIQSVEAWKPGTLVHLVRDFQVDQSEALESMTTNNTVRDKSRTKGGRRQLSPGLKD